MHRQGVISHNPHMQGQFYYIHTKFFKSDGCKRKKRKEKASNLNQKTNKIPPPNINQNKGSKTKTNKEINLIHKFLLTLLHFV